MWAVGFATPARAGENDSGVKDRSHFLRLSFATA
jgi:hypothetical protein